MTQIFFYKNWLSELNLFFFFNVTEKNWTLFFAYDSKNWTFFEKLWLTELNPSYWYDSQNGTLPFNLTQRTEPFSKYYSKNWTLFNIWLEELNPFSKYYSKNWTLFNIWLEEMFFFHIIPILESYFKIGSQNWFFFKLF